MTLFALVVCGALAVDASGDDSAAPASKSSKSADVDPSVWQMDQRDFQIPIYIPDPVRRARMAELHLFVSTDKGKTWEKAATATPDRTAFDFHAPTDGLYWFAIQVVDKDQVKDPPALSKLTKPGAKILVDTSRKTEVKKAPMPSVGKEIADLRSQVNELEKRVAHLEVGLKDKPKPTDASSSDHRNSALGSGNVELSLDVHFAISLPVPLDESVQVFLRALLNQIEAACQLPDRLDRKGPEPAALR